MGNIFSASEIVEIGIQIEKNGLDFYNNMAEQSKIQKAIDIYKYLAQQEQRHIEVFQKILEKTDKYEPAGIGSDDYYAYMNALASEHVFTQKDKGKELANKVKSDREAVDMGIRVEEDSIIFYGGMKKVVPGYDQRIVEEVIAQEQGHLKQLIELKKSL